MSAISTLPAGTHSIAPLDNPTFTGTLTVPTLAATGLLSTYNGTTTAGLGMPSFWIGTTLIILLGLVFPLFPVGGYGTGLWGHANSMFLPCLTIAISIAPTLLRSLRTSLIDALGSDYVAFARAKGLSARSVLYKYGFRNAAISAVSVLGR